MALTPLQRSICRILADSRIASGESYVAGGAALNELLLAPRISRDVDLFHDTETALDRSWQDDRKLLAGHGFAVRPLRERPSFIEAEVSRAGETVLLQWVRDSAYRFFPLVEHPIFGLSLHSFDLATNKVLALVGRLEVRDWIDVIHCDQHLQPFGYLAWAACGKDPGFSPVSLLDHAARTGRYSAEEVNSLSFEGTPPDAGLLGRQWHALLVSARETVDRLPGDQSGKCVLDGQGQLFRGLGEALGNALSGGGLVFRSGSIRGVLPQLVETPRA
jgi:hypothetical protein